MGKPLPIITLLPTSHEEIVTRYVVEKRLRAQQERDFYPQLPTVAEAARQAALALTPDGTRHSHQRPFRVRQETLDAWAEPVLANLDWLASAENIRGAARQAGRSVRDCTRRSYPQPSRCWVLMRSRIASASIRRTLHGSSELPSNR
jgi:hypothetical protein